MLRRKENSTEYCGFIFYVLCYLFAFMYLLWMLVPDEILHSIDIIYYPSKSYALYIPTVLLSLCTIVPVVYASYNNFLSPAFDSLDTLLDMHSRHVCSKKLYIVGINNFFSRNKIAGSYINTRNSPVIESLSTVHDIDIADILYDRIRN